MSDIFCSGNKVSITSLIFLLIRLLKKIKYDARKGLRIPDLMKFLEDHGHEAYLPSKTRTGENPKICCPWLVNVSDHQC